MRQCKSERVTSRQSRKVTQLFYLSAICDSIHFFDLLLQYSFIALNRYFRKMSLYVAHPRQDIIDLATRGGRRQTERRDHGGEGKTRFLLIVFRYYFGLNIVRSRIKRDNQFSKINLTQDIIAVSHMVPKPGSVSFLVKFVFLHFCRQSHFYDIIPNSFFFVTVCFFFFIKLFSTRSYTT